MTERQPPLHVLLYGPPAAGKLTVATALAAQHGLALLDNHATFDLALRVFDFGTPEFLTLLEESRVLLLRSAAAAGRDVVSTLVFADPDDRPHAARLIDATTSQGGRVVCVQLRPPPEVLEQRVVEASRASMRKIRSVEVLRGVVSDYELYSRMSPEDLCIDNTRLSPEEAASLVAVHAGLAPGGQA